MVFNIYDGGLIGWQMYGLFYLIRLRRLSGYTLLLGAAVNYFVIQPVQKLHKLPGTAKKERNCYDDITTIFYGTIYDPHNRQLVYCRFE